MNKIKALLISAAAVFALAVPVFAAVPATAGLFDGAKNQACSGANLNDTACTANEGAAEVNSTISVVINLMSFIVGVVSVIMIIIGGIRFVTSQGDSQSASGARNTVIFAIIGLCVAAFAQLIVRFVLGKATI